MISIEQKIENFEDRVAKFKEGFITLLEDFGSHLLYLDYDTSNKQFFLDTHLKLGMEFEFSGNYEYIHIMRHVGDRNIRYNITEPQARDLIHRYKWGS
ncbi:MAG: hypothetical protein V3U54_13220 [Thermodesulfobacteriota bacterium]